VKGITLGVLRGLKIPLPPLPEQRRIAGILDQADALRRLRRQSLSRLSDLGQAIFYEMFGDLVTNPNGWPEKAFRDLATRITVGIVVKPASYYREAGVPAIRGTNIKLEGIDLSDAVYFSEHDNEKVLSKTRVWTDDLVIVRSGRPGLAALVPPEMSGINSIDVLILTPDKDVVVPRFVKDLINSPMGKRLILSESRGQVQQHFNVGSLSKAKLFLPPYDLQLEYLSRISAFDEAAARRSESEEMLDSLFASLQHRAFRGEL
jgi:type I restriction enzyme S subunit